MFMNYLSKKSLLHLYSMKANKMENPQNKNLSSLTEFNKDQKKSIELENHLFIKQNGIQLIAAIEFPK